MKLGPLIPPVIALALAGIWIAKQHQSISVLEDASATLQKQLAAARSSGPDTDPASAKSTAATQATKNQKPLDWKKAGAQLAESDRNDGMGDLRAVLPLKQRIQAMSQAELIAALDEVATLDLPADSLANLEQALLEALIVKDPELALTRFIDRIDVTLRGSPGMLAKFQFNNTFKDWATKDPAKAAAWFDQQIATGKLDSKALDGKSRLRDQFEGALIGVLLGTAPDTASHRLGAIPADQRVQFLYRNLVGNLNQETFPGFATLIREQVPEKQQIGLFAYKAYLLGRRESYAEVTAFMDGIAATPAERVACVERAADSKIRTIADGRKITREDLDTLREWTTRQAPDSTGPITGKALADAMQNGSKLDYAAASELALYYHQASGNDDVLISFLDRVSDREKTEQARALAANITDATRREEILKKLQ